MNPVVILAIVFSVAIVIAVLALLTVEVMTHIVSEKKCRKRLTTNLNRVQQLWENIPSDVLPVGVPEKLDVVYTWVRNDEAFAKMRHAEQEKASGIKKTMPAHRFNDHGELQLSVSCLLKHSRDLIRNIYIVTIRPQVPEFMLQEGTREADRILKPEYADVIKIVHHDEFFPSYVKTPCFNSNVIEAELWRIPGLTDKFLYSNDDFITPGPLTHRDLFTPDGQMIMHIDPSEFYLPGYHSIRKYIGDDISKSRYRTAERFPLNDVLKISGTNINDLGSWSHVIIVVDKQIVENLYKDHEKDMIQNSALNFRTANDLVFLMFAYPNYSIATGKGIAINHPDYVFYNSIMMNRLWKDGALQPWVEKRLRNAKYVCVNDDCKDLDNIIRAMTEMYL